MTSSEIDLPPQPSKRRGRKPGANSAIFKRREINTPELFACRAFASGVDPVRQYLPDGERFKTQTSALRELAAMLRAMADLCQGDALKLLKRADDECLTLADKIKRARTDYQQQAIQSLIQRATAQKLKPMLDPKDFEAVGLLAPEDQGTMEDLAGRVPAHLATRNAYKRHLYQTNTDIEFFDDMELDAQIEQALSDWLKNERYHYAPNFRRSYADGFRFPNPLSIAVRALYDQERPALGHKLREKLEHELRNMDWVAKRHPAVADPVSMWFTDPTLATLRKNELFSLGSIEALIKLSGKNWHKQLRNLGAVRATEIAKWLMAVRPQGTTLNGNELESVKARRDKEAESYAAATPPTLLAYGLDPLTPYIHEERLNGTHGTFRTTAPNMAGATNDIEALISCLRKHVEKRSTLQVYAREIVRFCLWIYKTKARPLSSATIDDARDYRGFLGDIPGDWITPQGHPVRRGSAEWRPFRAQLDPASQRKALSAISSVFEQLLKIGYITGTPMAGVIKDSILPAPKINAHHALTTRMWLMVADQLDSDLAQARQMPTTDKKGNEHVKNKSKVSQAIRLRALLHFLKSTGLRRAEAESATKGAISFIEVDDAYVSILSVVGKGRKQRDVPLEQTIIELVIEHHRDVLGDVNKASDSMPLFLASASPFHTDNLPLQRPMTGHTMYTQIKGLFARCSVRCTSPQEKQAFLDASTHWMRHTFGKGLADHGASTRAMQALLGHSDPATTSIYTKSEMKDMVREFKRASNAEAGKIARLQQDRDKKLRDH
jgi:site-specific recombinase XerD